MPILANGLDTMIICSSANGGAIPRSILEDGPSSMVLGLSPVFGMRSHTLLWTPVYRALPSIAITCVQSRRGHGWQSHLQARPHPGVLWRPQASWPCPLWERISPSQLLASIPSQMEIVLVSAASPDGPVSQSLRDYRRVEPLRILSCPLRTRIIRFGDSG
jgi:hypothetical protein